MTVVRSAFVYIFSIFSASLPETVEKGGCFFDSNCTKQGVVLRVYVFMAFLFSVSTRCA